jgi:hypothetical protein
MIAKPTKLTVKTVRKTSQALIVHELGDRERGRPTCNTSRVGAFRRDLEWHTTESCDRLRVTRVVSKKRSCCAIKILQPARRGNKAEIQECWGTRRPHRFLFAKAGIFVL